MEIRNSAPDVVLGVVSQQVEFCLVGMKDSAIGSDEVQRDTAIFEEILEIQGRRGGPFQCHYAGRATRVGKCDPLRLTQTNLPSLKLAKLTSSCRLNDEVEANAFGTPTGTSA